jgi:hypothetical protein
MGTALNSTGVVSANVADTQHVSLAAPLSGRRIAARASRHAKAPARLGSRPRWQPNAPGKGNRLDVSTAAHSAIPPAQGLFNPENDRDACGVGFVGELSKRASRKCVTDAMGMLARMTHRGACGCETNTGAPPTPGSEPRRLRGPPAHAAAAPPGRRKSESRCPRGPRRGGAGFANLAPRSAAQATAPASCARSRTSSSPV